MRREGALYLALGVLAACSSGVGLDDDARRRLESTWELYEVGDPAWDTARERWYAQGGEARVLLIDLLARDMLMRSMEREWRRPQRELLLLPADEAAPRLLALMRRTNDPPALEVLAETLAGYAADDLLIAALEDSTQPTSRLFRHYALSGLVRCGGSRAVQHALDTLAAHPDWELRAAAADALAQARLSDRPAAAAGVAATLAAETDPSVQVRALIALRELGEVRAAPPVAEFIQPGRAGAADARVRAEACATLRALTHRMVAGDDPAQWRVEAVRAAAQP